MPSMRTRRSSPGWKSASGCTSPQAPATNARAISREQTPSRPPTSKRTSDAMASTTFASATSPSAIGTLHGSGSTALRLNWATRFVRLMKMSCASIRSAFGECAFGARRGDPPDAFAGYLADDSVQGDHDGHAVGPQYRYLILRADSVVYPVPRGFGAAGSVRNRTRASGSNFTSWTRSRSPVL